MCQVKLPSVASAVFILQSEEAEIVVFESHVDTQGGGTRTTKQGSHCFSVYAETTESSESTLDESAFTLNLSDGEWHTFGVEWWGDGDNNGLRFYVDGVLTMESASDSSVDGNTGCIHASAMKASMMVELGNAPLDDQDGDILKVKSYHRWTPAKYGPEPYVHLSKAQVESRHSNDAFLPWHRGAQAEVFSGDNAWGTMYGDWIGETPGWYTDNNVDIFNEGKSVSLKANNGDFMPDDAGGAPPA